MALERLLHYAETRGIYGDFIRSCNRVEEAQQRVWRDTQRLIANGTFWKNMRGHVSRLRHLQDFDITTYADYEDALHRDYVSSDTCSLTGEKIPYWIESSASTGRPKIYPATRAFFRDQCTGPALIFSHALIRQFASHMRKPALSLAGNRPSKTSDAGVPTGLVTYWGHKKISRSVQRMSALPMKLYEDSAAFEAWAPVYAVASDVASIRSLSPSGLRRFLMNIVERQEELWPYLERRKALPNGLPPLSVTRRRIQVVRSALARPALLLKELWPSLEFIRCWKTASCGLQLSLLAPYLTSDVHVIDHIYGTSEGSLGVPILIGQNGGPALVSTIIIEFVEVGDEVCADNLIPIWQLKVGHSYRIFLTNKMGLVRYRVGDIVRCTGHFAQAPILEFVEREAQDLSFGSATITEGQLVETAKRIGLSRLSRWVFAPNPVGNGLMFYFDSSDIDGSDLARRADEALCEMNALYSSCTRRGTVAHVRAALLPSDHELWGGAGHAQSKERVLVKRPI